jgi:GNAT superfamily N-acetyltransferase
MSTTRIREARLDDDKSAILEFIFALQVYEQGFEANRRIDPQMAEEHYAVLIAHVEKHKGKILVAEDEAARPIGWAAFHEEEGGVFILADERKHGFLAELYVVEAARGAGVGRALIAACEAWARGRGLVSLRIGLSARNGDALKVYERVGYTPYALQVRKYL